MAVFVELSLLTCQLQSILSYPHYIFEWDLASHRFVCNPNFKEYVTPFNVINTFTNTILTWGVGLYLIVGKGVMDSKSISIDTLFLSVIGLIMNWLVIGTNWTVYCNRFEIVEFITNSYNEARSTLFSEERPLKNIHSFGEFLKVYATEVRRLWKTGKGDTLGIMITGASIFLFIFPLTIGFGIGLLELDIVGRAVKYIYPPESRNPLGRVLCKILTTTFASLYTWEVCRTARMFYMQALVVARIAIKLVENVRQLFDINPNEALKQYQHLYLIHNTFMDGCSKVLYVAMQTGSQLAIFTCAGTIVGWKVLSPFNYALAPAISFFILFLMTLALPMAEKTEKWSNYMIREWRRDVASLHGSRVVNRRVLRCLKPIGFPVYGYGLIDREFKTKLRYRIMDNTMDACLMALTMAKH